MLITKTSPISGITRTMDLPITEKQMNLYACGAMIQDAFPDLTADEREFLKSGINSEEWNQMFPEESKRVIPELMNSPTSIDLLNRAKDYLMNMNDSISFEIAMEIQKHLDSLQENSIIDSSTL